MAGQSCGRLRGFLGETVPDRLGSRVGYWGENVFGYKGGIVPGYKGGNLCDCKRGRKLGSEGGSVPWMQD